MMTSTQNALIEPYAAHVLTGNGAAVGRLRMQVTRIAPHFRLALITGERGVGKLAVAREMHRLSPAADTPFRVLGASEFLEKDQRRGGPGTLVLRDLGSLRPEAQEAVLARLKLLSRDTRVMVISGTDLKAMAAAGRMRQDLSRGMGILEIHVPALRERLDDFEFLAAAMLWQIAPAASFTASALDRMRAQGWQGNLSELWEFCAQMARARGAIEPHDLPAFPGAGASEMEALKLDDVIRRHVLDVLGRCAGNKLKAAEVLGISRSTLYRMLGSETDA